MKTTHVKIVFTANTHVTIEDILEICRILKSNLPPIVLVYGEKYIQIDVGLIRVNVWNYKIEIVYYVSENIETRRKIVNTVNKIVNYLRKNSSYYINNIIIKIKITP